jgi:predicted acyl esterase
VPGSPLRANWHASNHVPYEEVTGCELEFPEARRGKAENLHPHDTIDWLVKHVPQSNGRVGTIGGSYQGYTARWASGASSQPIRLTTASGYQHMIAGDIFRGRYREDPAVAHALTPNQALPYRIRLPNANHTFVPGHRIMVQIQSSWFPLYDRNPQRFVANIMYATLEDYTKATQRIWHSPGAASAIELPVIGSVNGAATAPLNH